MFEDDVALLEEGGGRREVFAFGESAALIENPGIADRAAGDGDAIDAGLTHHFQAVVRRKEVAAAEDGFVWSGVLLDFGEELPAAGAVVALDDGAAVDGDGGDAGGEGTVEDGEEVVAAVRRVVEAAAHLHGDGNVSGNGFARAADDFESDGRLAEVKSTPATAENFFHRAAEVDVDDVEAGFDQLECAARELVRLGTHQLSADGAFVVGEMQEMAVAMAVVFHRDQKLVEHHFAERIRSTVASSEQPHRPVAIAGECSLNDGEANFERTDF